MTWMCVCVYTCVMSSSSMHAHTNTHACFFLEVVFMLCPAFFPFTHQWWSWLEWFGSMGPDNTSSLEQTISRSTVWLFRWFPLECREWQTLPLSSTWTLGSGGGGIYFKWLFKMISFPLIINMHNSHLCYLTRDIIIDKILRQIYFVIFRLLLCTTSYEFEPEDLFSISAYEACIV